ncbi:MAG: DUF1207 domain-containing protein [Bacteroidetes bacterium]|jgi:hypothetical protein|nr:DUF1207 domain-containing protein [Bacteroidota bacterium]MBT3751038.1 DUF1207 domain-containing protein [Bacteroidota bacterium]MBT4399955.1 DUF1207 domain-containing protein [Bacteroidota bacterium]MBT4412175.1 DUF1207 domain-containing protein [Bacteroidota bacterium]MBT5427543.1 DUF1207 domain-containing protein [Bacteroidota bacterium]
MKKILFLIVVLLLTVNIQAQIEKPRLSFPIGNWNLRLISMHNLYPTYLADPLGVRFETLSQNFIYSDFDHNDEINQGGDYKGKLTLMTGARFSLFRFSPKDNPELGIEIDLGIATPQVMRGGNHDLLESDGIYYLAIAARPSEWLALRFSKHHICTHLGDEFVGGTVNSPTDYDPNITQLPVRDDFILSAAVKPLYFLGIPQLDILQVYGDFGFFLPGVDFLGRRQNKPNRTAYLNFQGGAELEYYFANKYFGGIFSAVNVSSYQLNSFSPNVNISGGYIFPQKRNAHRLRIGMNYYNGRSLSNQFYNRKEKFVAFHVAVDF